MSQSPLFLALESLVMKIKRGEIILLETIKSDKDLNTIFIDDNNEDFFTWLKTVNRSYDSPPLEYEARTDKLACNKFNLRQYVDAVRILELMPQAAPLPRLAKAKMDKHHLDFEPEKRDCLQIASRLSAINIMHSLAIESETAVMGFLTKLREKNIPKAANPFKLDDIKRLILDAAELFKYMEDVSNDMVNKPRQYATASEEFSKINDKEGLAAVDKIQNSNRSYLSLKKGSSTSVFGLASTGSEGIIAPADAVPIIGGITSSSSSSSSSKHSSTSKRMDELMEIRRNEDEHAHSLWLARAERTSADNKIQSDSLSKGMVDMARVFVEGQAAAERAKVMQAQATPNLNSETTTQPGIQADQYSSKNSKALRNKLTQLLTDVTLQKILEEAEVPDHENFFEEIKQKLNKPVLLDIYSRSKGDVDNFSKFLHDLNIPFVCHGMLFNYLEIKEELFA